jgi:hypothetical protein
LLALWFWFLLAPLLPQETAEAVAAREHVRCPFGCVVAFGHASPVSAGDRLWLGRVLQVEVGVRFEAAELPATAWTLTQGWAAARSHRPRLTFSSYLTGYSAACSRAWATGGVRHSDRISPRATSCRSRPWERLRPSVRRFVDDFLAGRIPNLFPGWIHALAAGFERWAAPDLGPALYADLPADTAYFQTPETAGWQPWTVRIVGATR